ncbi:heterokaryon incompatibility protein-domain-containing protein, partial [Phaeosphaeria sp. MPI-PUGE-AT-0046c]
MSFASNKPKSPKSARASQDLKSTSPRPNPEVDDSPLATVASRSTSPDTSYFVHEPLRLDIPSIRLVELLSPSENGTIRCAIRHTTLDAKTEFGTHLDYTCLSYVWGPPTPNRSILMNGKLFKVRENLWQFLRAISSPELQRSTDGDGMGDHELEIKPWFKNLWIDALSIDQANLLERNHQVQQMGRIYTCAKRVLSWMGDSPEIATLFAIVQRLSTFTSLSKSAGTVPFFHAFCKSMYWKRAWVTQELLLARTLFIQAEVIILPLWKLVRVIDHRNSPYREFADPETRVLLSYLATRTLTLSPRVLSSLIENLETFRNKQCADIRDRVYSLLSVSRDGERIAVDYRSGPAKLARRVLHTMK